MIRVRILPRLLKNARRLSSTELAEVNDAIALAQQNFGQPQLHTGAGLRKLGRRSYEVRAGLRLRVVLILESDELVAIDVMDHNQVRQWLKGRRGE
jgi:hypothetical protein